MPSRSETLLAPVPRSGRVIEIGPSFSPIAPKAEGWDVCSLDHLSREGLIAKYTGHPGVDTTRIEDVDYVWTGGPLSTAVPAAMHGTFDAFVASHVIEHTPDLIAFLDSAATLLKSDGIVVLAVPDKRYCFDHFQPLTTAGEVLQAHAEQRSRHSRRLMFDHVAYAVENGGVGAWSQQPSNGFRFMHRIEQARAVFGSSTTDYVDVHAWRFTPASFQLLVLELARLGETDWRVERVTEAVGCEFFAWLRRGGMEAATLQTEEAIATRRMTLLKRTMLEIRAQIDWLLAGEPELVTGPLGLLPTQAATPPVAPSPPAPNAAADPASPRYVDWFPAKENSGRAFEGEWSSAVPGLPTTGNIPLFEDGRITLFEERLGGFAGKEVLELGPLEGGHTYMMAQRGAIVTAIESNTRAWMRCLVAKDALGMQGATFLLGDFVRYLAESPPRVDFALASGVLYHMTDPATVLRNLGTVGNAIGLWTHYFDPNVLQACGLRNKFDFKPHEVITPHGRVVEYYGQSYLQALEWKGFCGGSAPGSNWMRKQDIIGILEDEGFTCESFLDHPDHPNGPAFCVFGQRK
jgi:2-polyprenyl-3-methyl-5-hydroxy-6-metoxy-1,4-benzoquinol methylase